MLMQDVTCYQNQAYKLTLFPSKPMSFRFCQEKEFSMIFVCRCLFRGNKGKIGFYIQQLLFKLLASHTFKLCSC